MPTLRCVMLVDDNKPDNFLHKLTMQKAGFAEEILEFKYADDALSFLRTPGRAPVDLILLDLNMPRMDGFEFADAFAALYPELKSNTVLVMLSGSINPSDQRRADAHPAIDGFLVKPVDLDALNGVLERAMAADAN